MSSLAPVLSVLRQLFSSFPYPTPPEHELMSFTITRQILERSGVGSSDLLKKLDIKVVSDLPGVGYGPVHLHFFHYSCANPPSITLASNTRIITQPSLVCLCKVMVFVWMTVSHNEYSLPCVRGKLHIG